MKVKYPVEAFALTMILFSTNMKEAFVAGAIVLVAITLAMFLKNILAEKVPNWSLYACVLIGTASVCASGFEFAFYSLGSEFSARYWIMTFVIGLLAGNHAIKSDLEADYDGVFFQAAVVWGMLLLLTIAREFLAFGSIAEYQVAEWTILSKSLQKTMFGFITAGMGIAFTNGILKITLDKQDITAWVCVLALCFPPMALRTFPEVVTAIVGAAAVGVGLYAIKNRIAFSNAGKAFRRLPVELLSVGFLYMILSVF